MPKLLLEEAHKLRTLVGSAIERVHRQIYRPDYDYFSSAVRDERSDGSVELHFDTGEVWHFVPWTNAVSVAGGEGAAPKWSGTYFAKEVTSNDFWTMRTGVEVVDINFYVPRDETRKPVAVRCLEFEFANGLRAALRYVDDAPEQFDALRVEPRFEAGEAGAIDEAVISVSNTSVGEANT